MLRDRELRLLLGKNLILLGCIVFLFLLNYYSKTLFFRPSSTHQWRQTDCLSIAKNYYEEGMHFFQPKVHYQGPVDGKAVSELPVLNYTVAALWKVFGEHEFIYRLLEYLIYVVALFVFYNTIGRGLGSYGMAFLAVTFLLTSPLLTFYSFNFLADVPALSFGIISLCLFYHFYRNKSLSLFYGALILGTLAVLMKASAVMAFGLIVFFSLSDLTGMNNFLGTEKLFRRKFLPSVVLLLAAAAIIGWYRFALRYNINKTNNVFLLTVLPIWEMPEAEILRKLKALFNSLFPLFLNKAMLFFFFVLVIYVIARFRSLPSFFKYSFSFAGIYFIAYLIFFFQVFDVHDYYLNNLMIFPVITLMAFTTLVIKGNFLATHRIFLRLLLIVVFVFSGFHSAAVYRLKMIEDDKMVYWFPFVDTEEQKLYKYLFWDYARGVKKIEEFRPELRRHGIRREDKILSVPDQSFDISLYFMDQKGYAISREHFELDSLVTEHFRGAGLRYFVLADTTLKLQPSFKHLAPHLEAFFSSDGVQVFKIKSSFR